jgi:MFS family permease
MNTVMNPILSTVSDRCRSRLGRRIPFILYTALPTALFMAAMPFYSYLLPYLPPTLLGGSMQGWLLGFGAIICNFFWLFVGILFYYLIPDVVPDKFIGRYFGMYRLAGALAGVFWGKYLFPYVESHPQIVYPTAAALYLIIILLMCYFVKEGSYPPVEKSDIQPSGISE